MLRLNVLLSMLLVGLLAADCTCGEGPQDPVLDAGQIGEGPPVDPDGGPPLLRDAGPVPCEEDTNEDNDVRADAVVLNAAGNAVGTFCGGDDDWYAVNTQDGCAVAMDLTFNPSGGDLDVLLFDPDGQLAGSASTLGDHESINVVATQDGTWSARVRGGERDAVSYAITMSATCPQDLTCPADDGLEDNDTAETAGLLTVGVAKDAIACPGDQDMYLMPVSTGCIADMRVTFVDADGDLDAELLRADGSLLGFSRGVVDNERILKVASEPGLVYRVILFGSADTDGNRYRLQVDEICAGDIACPADDPFEPNDTRDEPSRLDTERDQIVGALCAADEDFFDIVPTNACTLRAVLTLDTADGDLDLELLDTTGNRLAISAGTGGDEQIDYVAPSAARVVYRVYSFSNPGGATQSYRLTTTTTCD